MKYRNPLTACLLVFLTASTAFGKVEAIRGKRYQLTPNHGPWMIMVAALRDVPEDRRSQSGMTAWEAADALVYELRKKGIPAYTYLQKQKIETVRQRSGSSGADGRYIAQNEAIAVLAGNFSSPDQKQARVILNYLKNNFEPQFLKDETSGAILPRTPGRPRPLSRAHMTTNPLVSAADIKRRTLDPLVRQLNAGIRYSLLKNPGRYSLKVASFRGNAIIQQVGSSTRDKAKKSFNKSFGNSLDEAAQQAWELTQAMRTASKLGYDRDYEAWVFHDRYESYVTIGSFDDKNDPRIAALARMFHARTTTHNGRDALTAEVFSIPRTVKPGQQPSKYWVFDIKPKLVEVPRDR